MIWIQVWWGIFCGICCFGGYLVFRYGGPYEELQKSYKIAEEKHAERLRHKKIKEAVRKRIRDEEESRYKRYYAQELKKIIKEEEK